MGLDMYLRVRKKDWKDKIPNELLSKDGYYINESLSDEEFVKRLGYEKAMDLIMNKYLFVWHKPTTNYVGIDVTEEIGYWRKANAIHNWFVENCGGGVDKCQLMEISKAQLETLLFIAKKVKDSCVLVDGKINNGYTFKDGKEVPIMEDGKYIKDSSVAEELLPTTSGFFFGGTEYDQWYFEDIEDTIKQITEILETTDFDNEYITYQASW